MPHACLSQAFYANKTRFASDELKQTSPDTTDRDNETPVKELYATVVEESIEKEKATLTDNREAGHIASVMNAHIEKRSMAKVREKARERNMTKGGPQTRIVEHEKAKEMQKAPKVLKSQGNHQDARKVVKVVSSRCAKPKRNNVTKTYKVDFIDLDEEKLVKDRTKPRKVVWRGVESIEMLFLHFTEGVTCLTPHLF